MFEVEVKRIVEKREHPDADTLAIFKIEDIDLQLIGSIKYEIGDKVVYCPLDAVLPDWLLERLDLLGRLGGTQKNRVKAIRLRGIISQGLIFPVDLVSDKIGPNDEIVTDLLGITKYEEPEVIGQATIKGSLPSYVIHYDIQNAFRYKKVFNALIDAKTNGVVTEKLDGTNWSCAVLKNGTVSVHSHKCEVSPEDALYWPAAEKYEWPARLQGLLTEFGFESIVAYGELIGPKIQKNPYGLAERELRIFDILVNGSFVDYQQFQKMIRISNRHARVFRPEQTLVAPRIYHGDLHRFVGMLPLDGLATGASLLNPEKMREGIIIKPLIEQTDLKLGRVIFKLKSPEFLIKAEG